jgi:molybdopterin-guanine dinucleotide biosynthesis protein A
VADRLTGVLLLGGASERFGSAKALARLRGETLAERGWRLLGEACEERLAVGKAADRLPLPFPVLDDGAAERAPVFGVVAGLRAARHEVCVVLPVDCPRVTPGLLRVLGEARGVPHAGPLPGAYERALLPRLEVRLSAGELTLRGVVETLLDVDEALLADVDTPEELEKLNEPGHVLVVGGTGMLAGLSRSLMARGHRVTVVARRPVDLGAGVEQLALDYRSTEALERELARAVAERGPVKLAVAWIHTDAPAAPAAVSGAVAPGGRLVQVFGTRVWPLQPVPIHLAYRQVLLGSVAGRWLTHEEISAGVLAAIDADRPLHVVGERP